MSSTNPTRRTPPWRRIATTALTAATVVASAWFAEALGADGSAPQRGRNREREIAAIVELLQLDDTKTVADIGAGDGSHSVRLAPHVGHVYANEVTDDNIADIRRAVSRAEVDNVTVLRGSATATGLPAACCDGMFLRVVFHHLAEPEAMLADFRRSLKPGGLLLIIENPPQGGRNAPGVPDNRSGMGIDPQIVKDEVTAAGFELIRELDDWPSGRYGGHYAFLFRSTGADTRR